MKIKVTQKIFIHFIVYWNDMWTIQKAQRKNVSHIVTIFDLFLLGLEPNNLNLQSNGNNKLCNIINT